MHNRSRKTFPTEDQDVKLSRTQKIISILSYRSSSRLISFLVFLATQRSNALQRLRDGGLLCAKGAAITGEPQYVLMVESIELGGLIRTHGSTKVHLELIWILSAYFGLKIETRRDSETEKWKVKKNTKTFSVLTFCVDIWSKTTSATISVYIEDSLLKSSTVRVCMLLCRRACMGVYMRMPLRIEVHADSRVIDLQGWMCVEIQGGLSVSSVPLGWQSSL